MSAFRRLAKTLETCGIYFARLAERLLPIRLLWLLLWPVAALRAFLERGQFAELPPGARARVWRRRIGLNLTKFLLLWPDRLRDSRWQRRGEVRGGERFEQFLAEGRPLILLTLHFGPHSLLFDWLRARRLTAAGVIENAERRSNYHTLLAHQGDQANGLEGVPRFFEPRQVWDMHDFLQPHRLLIIAIDGGSGRQLEVKGEGYHVFLAPGSFQLAALTGAAVLPCLITAGSAFAYTIHFGKPISPALLANKRQQDAACAHLIQEFYPVIHSSPEQCRPELLSCFPALVHDLAQAARSTPPVPEKTYRTVPSAVG